MKTVHEVSSLTGLSIRTLQYYDKIGLLSPSLRTEAGYRLYGDAELDKLQQIMLLRELEFPLKEIKNILERPGFDRKKALEQQIKLLELRKEQLDKLIKLAKDLKNGGKTMDFKAFDDSRYKEYARKARETWGETSAYKEYEEKAKNRTDKEISGLAEEIMDIFRSFGKIKNGDPGSAEAQELTAALQKHITDNYYNCTDEILKSLGQMYAAGGDFTKNIDKAGGEGTAVFVNEAIKIFTR